MPEVETPHGPARVHLRPVKKKSKEKIDGLVALLMAVRQGRLQEQAFQGGISIA